MTGAQFAGLHSRPLSSNPGRTAGFGPRKGVEALLGEILEQFNKMPDMLRQAITDQLWGDIPVTINESAFNPNLSIGGNVQAGAQTGFLELITWIGVAVPTGATGTLQLGNTFQFGPFPAGITVLPHMRCLLGPSDKRQLTIATAGGAAAIWLMGEQRPQIGVMAP